MGRFATFGLGLRPRCLLSLFLLTVIFSAYQLIQGAVKSFIHSHMFLGDPGIREITSTRFEVENSAARQACVVAQLELYPSKKFRDYLADTPKHSCPLKNWIKVERGVFRILPFAKDKFGNITCDYLPLLRGEDDFRYHAGHILRDIQDGIKITSDVSKITCRAASVRYENYHLTVPYVRRLQHQTGEVKLSKEALGMNVLMFGFDSVSRLTWRRKLPKTYDYMMSVLEFIVLEGYNIIGDGTPAALLPILTGETENQLPEARRGYPGAKPLDRHPWIWRNFERAGYVTHFTEDWAEFGTFQHRMLGFKKQPTDHYVRHFYMELEKKRRGRCLGSEYKHAVLFNYLKDFEIVYKNRRRFSFTFHNDLSHDTNAPLNIADEELKQWLVDLYEDDLLNNTMLVLMSDHGARYEYLRETVQGRIEERNPFFGVRLPPWFKTKYPGVYKNLRTNSKRLVTPYDIHETFHDILHFRNESRGNISKRGISIFSEIPAERTCAHAGVEPHWCNCIVWVDLRNQTIGAKIAKAFVDFVNNITRPIRKKCNLLHVEKVVRYQQLVSNYTLLKFMKKESDIKLYQLFIHTTPGGGHYEALAVHDVPMDKFSLKADDVSRTNNYGQDADCIAKRFPYLARFCHCKEKGLLGTTMSFIGYV